MRETITTRAVGPLQVRALPPEELDAIEADCGGIGGAFLQQVRREMGINLEDIAERTKIGSHWLRAIETEDRDSLPARVYLKGYLQQISRLLQLPPRVCDGYLERLAAAPAEARRA
jgi:flagellar biosynthesis protein FlhG